MEVICLLNNLHGSINKCNIGDLLLINGINQSVINITKNNVITDKAKYHRKELNNLKRLSIQSQRNNKEFIDAEIITLMLN